MSGFQSLVSRTTSLLESIKIQHSASILMGHSLYLGHQAQSQEMVTGLHSTESSKSYKMCRGFRRIWGSQG